MPRRPLILLIALTLTACAHTASHTTDPAVPLWSRWEEVFLATTPADEDLRLRVELTSPAGTSRTIDGFWDGDNIWKARYLPNDVGTWRYRTISSPETAGLHNVEGTFQVVASQAANPLQRHGAVQISDNHRHLVHADGTPFFWLGDTSWNGALMSTSADWSTYLEDRAGKGFNTIQFVTTQWRAGPTNAEGKRAYTGFEAIRINPDFFRRIDERIDAINEAGMLAAPVLLWALGDEDYTPGKLPESEAIKLARYLVARYQGNHVVWFLAGDENLERTADYWINIARAVFDEPGHAPVTLHPQGMRWYFEPFVDEPWFDFLIYQSGHGDDAAALEWIHSGPASRAWQEEPVRPMINSEPPYEGITAYQSGEPQSAYNVRRAVYWSLLSTPVAGVTYGGHGVWSWQTDPGVPVNHPNAGVAPPWYEAIHLPGAGQMRHVADFFGSLEWWRLRPARTLVLNQPAEPERFIGASLSEVGDLAVLYLPVGGTVRLSEAFSEAAWMDPRSGARVEVSTASSSEFTAPSEEDWVLVLRRDQASRANDAVAAINAAPNLR